MSWGEIPISVRVRNSDNDQFWYLVIAISTHKLHHTGGGMEEGIAIQEIQDAQRLLLEQRCADAESSGRLTQAIIVLAIAAVIILEGLNTALEAAVDLASPEVHPLAKAAKDLAAGMVLVAALAAAVVGFIILGYPERNRGMPQK